MLLRPVVFRVSPVAACAARGSVILLVLVILFFASLALSRFIEKAGVELLPEVRAADQARLRGDAYSALEVTLAVLADIRAIDGGLYSPAQGWGTPFDHAAYTPREGATVEITFEDESGKISLPRLDQTPMQLMFESFGLKQSDAERVTDALLVWMRPNHVAASFETDPQIYERADPPYQPPQRSLRSFQELAAIEVARDFFYDQDGQPTDLWHQFSQSVSLYNFDRANVNAANPTALAVAGFDSSQSGVITGYLSGQTPRAPGTPPYFRSLNEATALLGPNAPGASLGADVRCLRINVTVHEGAASFHLSAVVAPPGGASAVGPAAPPQGNNAVTAPATAGAAAGTPKRLNYPFSVLEVRENDDQPAPPPLESAA